MEKHRAIPAGYMKIGEVAKNAGVTVRTLQHYDKEGLLKPSAESEGGFRLYTHRDTVLLAQILMMKSLGFSLGEIKKRLASMDTPEDFMNVLAEQAAEIRKKIEFLTESLGEIEKLKEEVSQIEAVDFEKYAAILIGIQMKMEQYWLIKHFDASMIDHAEQRLGKQTATEISHDINRLNAEIATLSKAGEAPESATSQALIGEFWGKLMEFSGGDMEIIHKLSAQTDLAADTDKKWGEEITAMRNFTKVALEIYFRGGNGEEIKSGGDING